jgi:membrane protein YdbS with pleckstrin-like domain
LNPTAPIDNNERAAGRSRADTFGLIVAWFLLLAIGVQVAAFVFDNLRTNLWPAYDTNAYWLAARHLIDGKPLYAQAEIYTAGAYKYPPLFAQLVIPIGFLPEVIVDWVWRISGVLCLRYLSGSWKLALLASLQWPVFAELSYGNVTLQLGAVALWCFRDKRAVYLIPWFAGLKFGPALLIPYLWYTRPEMRRPIVIGCAAFAAACAISFVAAPGLWFDYLGTFGWETASQMKAMYVIALVPDHGGLDFALRFAIAAALILVAIRWKLDWLAFIAATATMPIFSLTRLAVLVALWPLWLRGVVDRWRQANTPFQRWFTAPLIHLDMLPRLPALPGAPAAPAHDPATASPS